MNLVSFGITSKVMLAVTIVSIAYVRSAYSAESSISSNICDLEVKSTNYLAYQKVLRDEHVYCEGIVKQNNSVGLNYVGLVGLKSNLFSYKLNLSRTQLHFYGLQNMKIHSVIKSRSVDKNYRRDQRISRYLEPVDWRLNIVKAQSLRLKPDDLLAIACSPDCRDPNKIMSPIATISDQQPSSYTISLSVPITTDFVSVWLANESDITGSAARKLIKEVVPNKQTLIDKDGLLDITIPAFSGLKFLLIDVKIDEEYQYLHQLVAGYDE